MLINICQLISYMQYLVIYVFLMGGGPAPPPPHLATPPTPYVSSYVIWVYLFPSYLRIDPSKLCICWVKFGLTRWKVEIDWRVMPYICIIKGIKGRKGRKGRSKKKYSLTKQCESAVKEAIKVHYSCIQLITHSLIRICICICTYR